MTSEKVHIPRVLQEMREEMTKAKELIFRLEKGQKVLTETIQSQQVIKALEAATLFNKLAFELNNHLEQALFMHEVLTTGRTTVVNRHGRAVNTIEYHPDETVEVDLFVVESLKKLEEVLGPNYRDSIELVKY